MSDQDPRWYMKYMDVRVVTPKYCEEKDYNSRSLMPFECRLRDLTYAARIYVDVEYTRGNELVRASKVFMGSMPIMLESSNCVLSNMSEDELNILMECPLNPGGYFVLKDNEKVMLVQEQLSKNRFVIEHDRLKRALCICAVICA